MARRSSPRPPRRWRGAPKSEHATVGLLAALLLVFVGLWEAVLTFRAQAIRVSTSRVMNQERLRTPLRIRQIPAGLPSRNSSGSISCAAS